MVCHLWRCHLRRQRRPVLGRRGRHHPLVSRACKARPVPRALAGLQEQWTTNRRCHQSGPQRQSCGRRQGILCDPPCLRVPAGPVSSGGVLTCPSGQDAATGWLTYHCRGQNLIQRAAEDALENSYDAQNRTIAADFLFKLALLGRNVCEPSLQHC